MVKNNQQKRFEDMMRTYCNSVDNKELNETTYRTLLGLWKPEIYSEFDFEIGKVFKYQSSDTRKRFSDRMNVLHKKMRIASVLAQVEKTNQRKRLEDMIWTYWNSVGLRN